MCIVSCHILAYLNIWLSAWLNVGVQIFFCLSGWLYGQKTITDDIAFYKKNAVKILVPYYLTVIPAIIVHFIFFPSQIDAVKALKVLTCTENVIGGGHLWFIPVILLCYVFTPILGRWFASYKNKAIWGLVLMLIITFILFIFSANRYHPAWLSCYIIGFFFGFCNKEKLKREVVPVKYIIAILAIVMNAAQAIFMYVLKIEFEGILSSLYICWTYYNHSLLGIALFLFMKQAFDRMKMPRFLIRLTDLSDQYSYCGYIVHMFPIYTPFTLMELTGSTAINILIIVCVIIVLSFLLKKSEMLTLSIAKRVFARFRKGQEIGSTMKHCG